MSLQAELQRRVASALRKVGIDSSVAFVTPASDTRYGDYQTNAAMVAAKGLKKNPREVATLVLSSLAVEDLCEPPTVAGAGFINFKVLDASLSDALNGCLLYTSDAADE